MDWGNRREAEVKGTRAGALTATGKSFWKPVEGLNKIEILPFIVKSKKHPRVASGSRKIGDPDYNIPVSVHTLRTGTSFSTIVCPKATYGLPCPICEEATRLWNSEASDPKQVALDKKNAKSLFAKERMIYNIVDCTNLDKGVQIYDASPFTFQEKLDGAQRAADSDSDIQDVVPRAFFADNEKGLSVKITGITKEIEKGRPFVDVSGVSLSIRKTDITPYLDKVVQLENFINIKTYDEIADLMAGVPTDDEEQEEEVVEAQPVAQEAPPVPPAGNACPFNHEFGKDNDMFPEDCSQCPKQTWKKCALAN